MKQITYIFLAIIWISCAEQDEPIHNFNKTTIQYKSMVGIDPNLHSLDVYSFSSDTTLKPVVIYVHGGGFVTGDKANQLTHKLNFMWTHNYVFVSVNYRLSPNYDALSDTSRVMYPDHYNDVADAIHWVFQNIHLYFGDTSKVAIMGHSAGAQIVSLISTSQLFLPMRGYALNKLKGCISVDTEGYDIPTAIAENSSSQMFYNAFGFDPTIWNLASPQLNLSSTYSYPKFLIAKRGTTQRITLANNFIDALMANGVITSQVDGSIYDHEGINNAIGKQNETTITPAIESFLHDCFN